jgi:hypothetical protein
VGYTVEVIGLLLSARLVSTQPAKAWRPIQQMLLIHAGFLAGVIVIERIFPLLQVLVPGGPTQNGRQGSWALLIEIAGITALGYVERRFLLLGAKSAPSRAWADAVLASPLSPAARTAPAVGAPLAPRNAAPVKASSGFATTAALSPAPVASASPAAAPITYGASTSSLFNNSTGEDYDEFLKTMQKGIRPFRKPGVSVKQEYELWLADRNRTRSGVPSKKTSGFGSFLKAGKNA